MLQIPAGTDDIQGSKSSNDSVIGGQGSDTITSSYDKFFANGTGFSTQQYYYYQGQYVSGPTGSQQPHFGYQGPAPVTHQPQDVPTDPTFVEAFIHGAIGSRKGDKDI